VQAKNKKTKKKTRVSGLPLLRPLAAIQIRKRN